MAKPAPGLHRTFRYSSKKLTQKDYAIALVSLLVIALSFTWRSVVPTQSREEIIRDLPGYKYEEPPEVVRGSYGT